jgi:predicted lactoylglutathione lyase
MMIYQTKQQEPPFLNQGRIPIGVGYSGYFADPDGYLWEVAWNPHFDLTNG